MEVACRLIIAGMLGAMLFVSASADIIVQPGYGQPSHGTKPPSHSEEVPTENHPHGERTLAEEFERYKTLHHKIEEQLVHLIHEQNAQNLQQIAPGLVGFPLILRPRVIRPILPSIGGGRLFSLTPHGAHGLHLGGYGIKRRPLLLRESDPYDEEDAARTQWTRSVADQPGIDAGITHVRDVAAQPAVDTEDADGVVQLQVPGIQAADDSIDKLIEPRQIGHQDDAIVGSPLDSIHYENPLSNKDQHHPNGSSGMSSKLMKAVNAVGNMIDSVAPRIMNYGNENSAPGMSRHQESNYRHDSQYPRLSQEGQRTGSPSTWDAPTTRSNNQPMTGQSYNTQQQLQNSKWSSNSPMENPESSKASKNDRYSQQTSAVYPVSSGTNNKNWLTTTHRHHPLYPNYQPDHQNYYEGPSSNYKPHIPHPSFPSGASSSATANVNNNQGFGPGNIPYAPGSHYPSGASSSATASANNNQGFGPGIPPYNSGLHYPNGASSSATASANNQPTYGPGFHFPGGSSSATANANTQQGYGPGSLYPSGATSSATASANNHPGFGNGGSPYNPGFPYTNGATASANANAGNSGYNYPYRSSYNNPYFSYNPYAVTNYVDQYGRSLFSKVPSAINSLSSNAGNYNEYLKSLVQNQLAGIYNRPRYSYYTQQ